VLESIVLVEYIVFAILLPFNISEVPKIRFTTVISEARVTGDEPQIHTWAEG